MPRTVDREARQAEIVAAAARAFATRGVARTSVADVVREAGVAQGTFYLYFDSKEEVVSAVAASLVEGVLDRVEEAATRAGARAVERFLALVDALAEGAAAPEAADLIGFVHLPGNRAVHDRMAEHLMPRLGALCESIVAQGVAEGDFSVPDARAAAWFVLGGLNGTELSGASLAERPASLRQAASLALRALGWTGGER